MSYELNDKEQKLLVRTLKRNMADVLCDDSDAVWALLNKLDANDEGAHVTMTLWVPFGEDANQWTESIHNAMNGVVRDDIGPFTYDLESYPCPHESFIASTDDDEHPIGVCETCGWWNTEWMSQCDHLHVQTTVWNADLQHSSGLNPAQGRCRDCYARMLNFANGWEMAEDEYQ